MGNRKDNELLSNGDIKQLEGLPKRVTLGKRVKRVSGDVEFGRSHVEGDAELGRKLVAALQARGECDRATHMFHSYPARLHPDAAKLLLEALPGQKLGDIFCGGGSVLLEGMLAGREVFGSDINPVALMVSRCRTWLLDPGEDKTFMDILHHILDEAKANKASGKKVWLPGNILKVKSWYKTEVFDEFACLYASLTAYQHKLRPLFDGVFSSLVVKYSLRASDTSNRVVYIPRKPGTVFRAFEEKSSELCRKLVELRKMLPKDVKRSQIEQADARHPVFGNLDLIITSPPYPGTYDYLALQQLRQAWFGWDMDEAEKKEIGSRRFFKQRRGAYTHWVIATEEWVAAAAAKLNKGGRLCVVVGEGVSGGHCFKVAEPTKVAAQKAGLKFVATGSVERKDPATHAKKIEYILVFEK